MQIVGSHLGRIPNCSEVPDTMYFIGGGGGQYPRAAKTPPPFFKFGSEGGGGLSRISDFRDPPVVYT